MEPRDTCVANDLPRVGSRRAAKVSRPAPAPCAALPSAGFRSHHDEVWAVLLGASPDSFAPRDLAALLCTERGAAVHDSQWERVARAHVVYPGFWELAAARPFATSLPLGSWKGELVRLLRYEARCRATGTPVSHQEIAASWQFIDARAAGLGRAPL